MAATSRRAFIGGLSATLAAPHVMANLVPTEFVGTITISAEAAVSFLAAEFERALQQYIGRCNTPICQAQVVDVLVKLVEAPKVIDFDVVVS